MIFDKNLEQCVRVYLAECVLQNKSLSKQYKQKSVKYLKECSKHKLLNLVFLNDSETLIEENILEKSFIKIVCEGNLPKAQRPSSIAAANNNASVATAKTGIMKGASGIYNGIKNHPGLVLGAVAAVGLGAIAIKMYRNYFSKDAVACRGRKGKQLQYCIHDNRAQSADKVVQNLRMMLSKCQNNVDPASCTSRIEKEIRKYEMKRDDEMVEARTFV